MDSKKTFGIAVREATTEVKRLIENTNKDMQTGFKEVSTEIKALSNAVAAMGSKIDYKSYGDTDMQWKVPSTNARYAAINKRQLMAIFEDYKGLKVLSPEPVGDGGKLLQDNTKEIADTLAWVYKLFGITAKTADFGGHFV